MAETWPTRLRRDRMARGWSSRDLARAIIASGSAYADYPEDSVERMVKRWETGSVGMPKPAAQEGIARALGTVRAAYFQTETAAESLPRALSRDATAEVIARLRGSALDSNTLDQARIAVDQLCVDYASLPGPTVLEEADRWLKEIERVRAAGQINLRQLTEVFDLAGWLSLLVACLRHDAGDEAGAERMRRNALLLGRDLGSADITGWGHEVAAWMALTRGDWEAVIAAAGAGIAEVPRRSVTVQLHALAAKGWARIGNRVETARSLETGRGLLERLSSPTNTRNHFVVDPAKWDFYAMDCARLLADDALAWTLAENVVRTSTTPTGKVVSPMRVAEAELTMATVEARAGAVDQAASRAVAALGRDRRSLPSLLLVGQEVAAAFDNRPGGDDFRRHLSDLRLAG